MAKRIVKSRTGEILIKGDNIAVNDNLIVKNKFDAILPPSNLNDSSQGYSAGSQWLDTLAEKVYFCANSSVGSAVWISSRDSA